MESAFTSITNYRSRDVDECEKDHIWSDIASRGCMHRFVHVDCDTQGSGGAAPLSRRPLAGLALLCVAKSSNDADERTHRVQVDLQCQCQGSIAVLASETVGGCIPTQPRHLKIPLATCRGLWAWLHRYTRF